MTGDLAFLFGLLPPESYHSSGAEATTVAGTFVATSL